MDRMGAAGECDSFAALAVIYEDDMRERLGWVLLALAVILLLASMPILFLIYYIVAKKKA